MEKYLRPDRFDEDPSSSEDLSPQWTHWKNTFENFLTAVFSEKSSVTKITKLQLLTNHLSPKIFVYLQDCADYDIAIQKLDSLFLKPPNEIYSRYKLAKRSQQTGETVDQYLQALRLLSKGCNFKNVTAEQNENEFIRDSFIAGLSSPSARQRLLENSTLTLDQAHKQARALEMARIHNDSYQQASSSSFVNAANTNNKKEGIQETCYFCGDKRHARRNCPAAGTTCLKCNKRGHFAKVCRSTDLHQSASTNYDEPLVAKEDRKLSSHVVAGTSNLEKAKTQITIDGCFKANALIDTGSTSSFIDERLVRQHRIKMSPCDQNITMAASDLKRKVNSLCSVNIDMQGHSFQADLLIIENLCADIIIGHDILEKHTTLEMNFGGPKAPLKLCALSRANIEPVCLFPNLLPNCKPIAAKSRRYSDSDKQFIKEEIKKLLADEVIEPSLSPWRAQVLVTRNENHKRRMCIDYSQTVNRYTQLDAYPLPCIEDVVSNIAKHRVFSKIDLKSAYHQLSILDQEKPYTAFEAEGNLYQFRRIPFGVTNGVSAFQRAINGIITKENLSGVYAYLDDITVCGLSQTDHDLNLQRFLDVVKRYNLTLNLDKSEFSLKNINILGYNICDGVMKPDPDRLRPLSELPLPTDSKSLRRVLGFFAHYSKWVPRFSQKIQPLLSQTFPLDSDAANAFEALKQEISSSAVNAIDDKIPFVVETDASDNAIAGTLSQDGRPVAFFSRTLHNSERNHPAIEKEAAAIVECLRKWRQFLIGRTFKLITDQKSVAFMFHQRHSSRIKNDKIQRWRLELSAYNFDIVYRPGRENVAADTLSRAGLPLVASTNGPSHEKALKELHETLCHPGVTRMLHWVRSKNLPYSVDEIKRITSNCAICAQVKPRFQQNVGKLIKATAPFERISIDFKGPLPSDGTRRNRYMLTIVDEYSRFPFAYPCPDLSTNTVIEKLVDLFSIFGMPTYVHSDRGTSFLSKEMKDFLHRKGIATSYTTPYNPQGNGQTERYNGIIWRTIQLALKSRDLPITRWETVLSEALHSVRSLLCTATNTTPHERMFSHSRRSSNGQSMPTWLMAPGKALMRKHVRSNKYDSMVEEVETLETNPQHSRVRLSSGREVVVSNRHLAPAGEYERIESNEEDEFVDASDQTQIEEGDSAQPQEPDQLRRYPERARRLPAYLADYVTE